jgi:uncharacterized ParB-like nuclease family protein
MPDPPKEESISVSLLPQLQKGKLVLKRAGIPLFSQQSVAKGAPSHKPAHTTPLGKSVENKLARKMRFKGKQADTMMYTMFSETKMRRNDETRLEWLSSKTPRAVLNDTYLKSQIKGASKSIKVIEADKGWTASFTCPVTGYIAKAGALRGAQDFHVIDEGVVYYLEASDAQHAVAARFLDNLRYTENRESEPRWCEEAPLFIEKTGIEKLFSDFRVGNKGLEQVPKPDTLSEEQHISMRPTVPAQYGETKIPSYGKEREESFAANYASWISNSNPKAQLNCLYQKSQILGALKSTVVTETDKGWTASFTCPLTGYTAEAGTLRATKDVHIIDEGVVYYKMYKGVAEHAAAARFLDNLRYTETKEIEPRWCEEVPSLIEVNGIEKLFSDFPGENHDIAKVSKLAIPPKKQYIAARHTIMSAVYRETKMRNNAVNLSQWMSSCNPKARLNNLYQKSQIQSAVKSIAVTKTDKGWTASFTCPVTGYIAKAGALRGAQDFHVIDEGVVYYPGPTDAQHAVTARFLDDLRYTEKRESEPRWCEEVPSLIENKGIEKLFSNQKLRKQEGTALETKVTAESAAADEESIGDELVFSFRPSSTLQIEDAKAQDADSENLVIAYPPSFSWNGEKVETSQSPSEVPTLKSHEDPSVQEPENEEELTIHNISSFKPVGTSTLERVMEALGETVTIDNNPSEGTNASSRGPIQTTPAQQKKKVIADTIAWYKRLAQQEKPEERGYAVFQTATLPVTVRSATTALRVLAKAHWSYPSEDPETDQRVEYAARQMLDLMWTAGSPSAYGYNSYLLCLARSSAAFEAAQAAELILRAMLERQELDGRLLPEPNIDTFNAAIQLWAVTGGSTGFSKCEEIFELMEEGREKGHALQPTRDTFLSVLSSLARPSSVDNVSSFDRERAQQWIERMRRQGEDNNDDTLTPDTQVFNAPLRWSGGNESTRSRPFTQGLLWDKYPDIFKEGFRPLREEDPLWIEARRIEEWLLEMETIGPAPDVETFEAAIQAWTRTGMADGLRRAELVALRAVASDKIRPRLQSFHPLFAAWAFSGDERGPEKIQAWITRLEEKSRTFPETKPDTRVQMSLYIAKGNQQKRLLARKDETGEGSEDQNIDAITKATQIAKSCSEDLGQLVGRIRRKRNDPKDVDEFLDPAIFSHALCAWGNVAVAKGKDPQSDGETLDGMAAETQEILGVVKHYDEAIQHLRSKQAAQHESSKEHPHFDVQLEQFLHHSQTVYLNALTYLNELDRQRKNQGIESSMFYQHFFDAESMLRRAEELRMVLHASRQSSSVTTAPEDVTLVYDDLFTYPSDIFDADSGKSYREKQIALYSEIVDGCKRMEGSDCFGDSVRLCMLIVDLLEHAPPTGQAADCTDVYLGIISVVENIPNEHERYQVLRRVFHLVNSSPFTIDKDSVMAVINQKEALSAVKGRKKPTRARRPVIRQRWRTASQS